MSAERAGRRLLQAVAVDAGGALCIAGSVTLALALPRFWNHQT
jgi:hypothetical protein